MKRSSLVPFAAAVLAAAVTVGLPASVASAAPGGKGPKSGSTQVVQADKRLAGEQRKVIALVATKDRALARAVTRVTRAALADQATVLENIAADRAALAELRAAAVAATTVTDLRVVGVQVHAVRPEIYSVVANGLRQAARFQELVATNGTTITELAGEADAKELEGHDVAGVRDLLASATLDNDAALLLALAAVEKGLVLTAFSDREERDAFAADVAAAGSLLDTVEEQLVSATDALAAMVPVEEPVVEPVV